jgi:uncharacterized OB-fold protein
MEESESITVTCARCGTSYFGALKYCENCGKNNSLYGVVKNIAIERGLV